MEGPEDLAAVLGVPGDGSVLAVGATELRWLEPGKDPLLQAVDQGARAAILEDLDSDGQAELVLCGEDGVASLAMGESLADPVVVGAEACAALIGVEIDGTPYLATAGEELLLWELDGTPLESLGVVLDGDPVLAARSGQLAAAGVGDDAFTVLSELGLSTQAAGGPLAWIGSLEGAWLWAVQDPAGLYTVDGLHLELDAEPLLGRVGDLDGDGVQDLALLLDGGLRLRVTASAEGVEQHYTLAEAASALDLSDLDGDGCDEIVLGSATSDEVQVWWALGCQLNLDRDGDGYTPDDGDCDDDDWSVNPGANETCDGRDEDCDGLVDEVEPTVALELVLEEGWDGYYYAQCEQDACDEGRTVALTGELDPGCGEASWWFADADNATCEVLETGVECQLWDQGEVTMGVTVDDPQGAVYLEEDFTVQIVNVAPMIVDYEWGCGGYDWDEIESSGEVYVRPGAEVDQIIPGYDPGTDTITFVLGDAPPGMTLSEDGQLVWSVDTGHEGSWPLVITLADEDGGSTTYELTIISERSDYEPWFPECEPCCGGSAGILLPPLLALWFRRRRLVPL